MNTATNTANNTFIDAPSGVDKSGFFAAIKAAIAAFGERTASKRLDTELSGLSDSYLADLGVSRTLLMKNQVCEFDRRMTQARVNYWV